MSRLLTLLALALPLSVVLAIPSVASATPTCEWRAADSTVVIHDSQLVPKGEGDAEPEHQVLMADWGINSDGTFWDCPGATRDNVQQFELQMSHQRATASLGYESTLAHYALHRRVKVIIMAPSDVPNPNLLVVFSLDRSKQPSPITKLLTAVPGGFDLDGDGVADVELRGFKNYGVWLGGAKMSGTVDLRGMPTSPARKTTVKLTGAAADTIYGPSGTGELTVLTGIGNDVVDTYDTDDIIDVGNGNDIVHSGGGDDTIGAGSGNDRVWAGAGNDRAELDTNHYGKLAKPGNDVADLGAGNNFARSWGGFDRVTGGQGIDILSLYKTRGAFSLSGGSDQVELIGFPMHGIHVDCGTGNDYSVYGRDGLEPLRGQLTNCGKSRVAYRGGIPWVFPFSIVPGPDGSKREFYCGAKAQICRNHSSFVDHNR